MDASTLLAIYVTAAIVSLFILYYLIKGAVKNAILEANEITKPMPDPQPRPSEKPPNAKQWELQKRYDKGEISFDEYLQKWKEYA